MRAKAIGHILDKGTCPVEDNAAGHVSGAKVSITKAGKVTGKCPACIERIDADAIEAGRKWLDRRGGDSTQTYTLARQERMSEAKKAKSTPARKGKGKGKGRKAAASKAKGKTSTAKLTPAQIRKLTRAELVALLTVE